MNSPNDCSDYFVLDPDISGIGVRISFYAQTVLLVLLVDRSYRDAPIALWTFLVTSFGLIISTISQGNISLLEALQVSNLVWLSNFAMWIALASYSRQQSVSGGKEGRHDFNVRFAVIAQILFSMICTILLWAYADSFGYHHECSVRLEYVVFFARVPALKSGRVIALVISSLLLAIYLFVTAWEVSASLRSRKNLRTRRITGAFHSRSRSQGSADASVQEDNRLRPPGSRSDLTLSTSHEQPMNGNTLTVPNQPAVHVERSPTRSRRKPHPQLASKLDPMLLGILICQFLVLAYFVICSELFIYYNLKPQGKYVADWQFGQTLALVVVIPSLLSVISAFKLNGFGRPTRKKRGRTSRRNERKQDPPDIRIDEPKV